MPTYRYAVNTTWLGAGSPGTNVWHFRDDDDLPGTNVQDVVDIIRNFYLAVYGSSLLPQGSACDGDDVVVDVATSETVPVTFSGLVTTSTDPEFAGPLQLIATKRTSSATRSGRGRIFIGPCAQGTLDTNGTPTSGAQATLQTACSALLSSSVALTDAAIGVYSPTQNLFRDLIGFDARDYFAVLRSRRD